MSTLAKLKVFVQDCARSVRQLMRFDRSSPLPQKPIISMILPLLPRRAKVFKLLSGLAAVVGSVDFEASHCFASTLLPIVTDTRPAATHNPPTRVPA